MKILILGGTGAMGGPLVEILAQNSYNDVYVTSRSERQSKYENVKFVLGDACDENFIASLLINKEYDAVVDFMTHCLLYN